MVTPGDFSATTELLAGHGWPVAELAACAQEPAHHGEGDVLTHTALVCDAMTADPVWMGAEPEQQAVLYLAGVLHDTAKAATARLESGAICHPGHARRGARMARGILWRAGLNWAEREAVCAVVAYHLKPAFLFEQNDVVRALCEMAEDVPLWYLGVVARADVLGRVCADQQRLIEAIELFEIAAVEAGVLERGWSFANPSSRVEYFAKETRSRVWAAWEDPTAAEVVVLSGLPGAGKDTWVALHSGGLPVVSPDAIRAELGVAPGGNQGAVRAAAKSRMRELLARNQGFVLNATNLTWRSRQRVEQLARDYGARVRIVAFEASPQQIKSRNRARGSKAVPETVLESMVAQWEFPSTRECHVLEVVS